MFGILVLLGLRESFAWAGRLKRRLDFYALARARADDLGRPLVVVGDPEGGWTRIGGYGNLCVDLTGCPGAPNGVKADLSTPGAIPLPDDSAVVFVSYVLELVPDIDAAWREILRVAGSPWNVYVLALDGSTLAAWFYPGVQHVITAAPPLSRGLASVTVRRPYVALAPR